MLYQKCYLVVTHGVLGLDKHSGSTEERSMSRSRPTRHLKQKPFLFVSTRI